MERYGPLFGFPVQFTRGEAVLCSYPKDNDPAKFDTEFWYQDLLLVE